MNTEKQICQSYNIREVAFIDEKKAEIEFKNRLLDTKRHTAAMLFREELMACRIQLDKGHDPVILENEDLGALLSAREEKENSGYRVLTDILYIGRVYFSFAMK
jgi:hypothetical protein